MAEDMTEKSISEQGKSAGAAAAEGAASAFREDLFENPNILINRPDPKGSDTDPQSAFRSKAETGSLEGLSSAAGGLGGGDVKHGIVTTYDENGNPTSDCNGPIPRPPKGWPGGINWPPKGLPDIIIDFHGGKK